MIFFDKQLYLSETIEKSVVENEEYIIIRIKRKYLILFILGIIFIGSKK